MLVDASNKQMAAEADEVAFELSPGPKCRSYPNVLGGWNVVCSR